MEQSRRPPSCLVSTRLIHFLTRAFAQKPFIMKTSQKVSVQTIQSIEKAQNATLPKAALKQIKGGSIIIQEVVIA